MEIKTSSKEAQVGYGYGYILSEHKRGFITGRLCTLIESFGLKDSQEKAAKDILRQEVDSWFFDGDTMGITDELNTAVHSIVHKIAHYNENNQKAQLPTQNGYGFIYEITAIEKD